MLTFLYCFLVYFLIGFFIGIYILLNLKKHDKDLNENEKGALYFMFCKYPVTTLFLFSFFVGIFWLPILMSEFFESIFSKDKDE